MPEEEHPNQTAAADLPSRQTEPTCFRVPYTPPLPCPDRVPGAVTQQARPRSRLAGWGRRPPSSRLPGEEFRVWTGIVLCGNDDQKNAIAQSLARPSPAFRVEGSLAVLDRPAERHFREPSGERGICTHQTASSSDEDARFLYFDAPVVWDGSGHAAARRYLMSRVGGRHAGPAGELHRAGGKRDDQKNQRKMQALNSRRPDAASLSPASRRCGHPGSPDAVASPSRPSPPSQHAQPSHRKPSATLANNSISKRSVTSRWSWSPW